MEMLLTPNSSPSEGYSEILQIPCQDCRLGADMFQAETNGQRVQMKWALVHDDYLRKSRLKTKYICSEVINLALVSETC